MKPAHLIILTAAAAAAAAYWYASRKAAAAAPLSPMGGTSCNTGLGAPFNLGTNIGYDIGAFTGNSYALNSSAGQGSEGFFSKPLQLSVTP